MANATRAAIEAGYSQKTARSIASENLTKPDIVARVQRRKESAMQAAQIHTDVIIGYLAEIETASLADVLDENGEFNFQKARGKFHKSLSQNESPALKPGSQRWRE